MKMCTITCHHVYNHGASLQAYGLMKYLTNQGHDVEIIDYRPDYLSNHYNLWSVNHPVWSRNIISRFAYVSLKLPGRIVSLKRKRAFDSFGSKYLKVSKSRYRSNEELKQAAPEADAYICGSDQIWNSLHKNGKDPAFYLDFVPSDKIKASYAASFATDTIEEDIKPVVKERVQRLDGIAVREKSGVAILEELGIDRAVTVMDPVFLLERTEWEAIGSGHFEENFILIYDFDNSDLLKKIALEIKATTGYLIYCVNPGKHHYADKTFSFVGPDAFVSLVRDAQFVLSNSYHAAVFSLIFEKNFAIVNRTEAINTRMRDLLDDLDLNSRLANEQFSIGKLLENIDYRKTNAILDGKIKSSKNYLNQLIEQRAVLT